MLISWLRGYMVIGWQQWAVRVYADTHEPADDSRPCIFCHEKPTKDGYDACLGYIQGATSVCCGHGVTPGYRVMKGGKQYPMKIPRSVVMRVFNGIRGKAEE